MYNTSGSFYYQGIVVYRNQAFFYISTKETDAYTDLNFSSYQKMMSVVLKAVLKCGRRERERPEEE